MEHARARSKIASKGENVLDFYDYLPSGQARAASTRRRKCEDWCPRVVDDWPEHIPITAAELDVIEAHFGRLLDELFGRVT